MTVIAWDGKTLAADKRAVASGLIGTTTKIRRIGDLLVGIAGNFSAGMEMLEWVAQGRQREACPAVQRDEDRSCGCLVIEGGANSQVREWLDSTGV